MELAAPPKYCMKDIWPSWYQLCHLLHYLQDKVQLQAGHEKCRSSVGPWTCSRQGPVCGGINLVDGWKQWETERERVQLCNVCDKDFKSLPTHNQQKIWQHIGHCLSVWIVARSSTPTVATMEINLEHLKKKVSEIFFFCPYIKKNQFVC